MPHAAKKQSVPPLLPSAHDAVTAAWARAARDLKPALKKLGGAVLSKDRAIATSVPGGVVAHAPIELKRPMKVADLYRRPHVVAAMMTTRSLVDRLTEQVLLPGTYVVRLRPAGHDTMALDLHDAAGKRVLATAADSKPMAVARAAQLDCIGIDVDIDELDDIINPFQHVICVSFLWWRRCFEIPTWIWPR